MRIAFVGGGTGGHFYPLIAVAEELERRPETPELYYIGPTPYEPETLSAHNIAFISCPAGKLRRYFSLHNILDLVRTALGVFVAIFKLYVLYPDVIFSKGGYTSVPVLIAAFLLRIPVVIHESDAVPGRANLLASSFARYIAISYAQAARFFPKEKTALIGIPIRSAIRARHKDPFGALGIKNDKPLVLVTGGSLGAERINNLILRSLDELLPLYRLFHLTGDAHYDELVLAAKTLIRDRDLLERYYIKGSVSGETMSLLLSAATLVVTRGGSTTLFEVALHDKPAIVIPIPEDVSRDQRTNAYAYARSGAATVIEEHNLTEHLLAAEIRTIIEDRTRYQAMVAAASSFAMPKAAATIADVLVGIGIEHGS
jgi:UDP-N-acetylglucosamine--N-acetylmuramyl-(pentapeptide) pyrophosphoryl-undecaprenol N-acetylglucosamine transferase